MCQVSRSQDDSIPRCRDNWGMCLSSRDLLGGWLAGWDGSASPIWELCGLWRGIDLWLGQWHATLWGLHEGKRTAWRWRRWRRSDGSVISVSPSWLLCQDWRTHFGLQMRSSHRLPRWFAWHLCCWKNGSTLRSLRSRLEDQQWWLWDLDDLSIYPGNLTGCGWSRGPFSSLISLLTMVILIDQVYHWKNTPYICWFLHYPPYRYWMFVSLWYHTYIIIYSYFLLQFIHHNHT